MIVQYNYLSSNLPYFEQKKIVKLTIELNFRFLVISTCLLSFNIVHDKNKKESREKRESKK